MKKYSLLYLIFCLISHPLCADLFPSQGEPQIVVNNRVLVRVNGKSISVMDVMKRMDVHFLKQYPEYTPFASARYQFYESQWQAVLEELVSKELVLADAEESKITVASGDVRQEMEQYFGPNIIENLDKIGLSFDEAYKMIEGELIVRRMISIRVNNKVFGNLTPQAIKNAYEEFAKNNIRQESWRYQVISIKNSDPKIAEATANTVYHLLSNKTSLQDLQDKLKADKQAAAVNISNELEHVESDLAVIIKDKLTQLTPETFSTPFSQKSRADNSLVYRIVYLKEKIPGGAKPFNEVELAIKDQLMEKGMSEESEVYLKRLRQHFDVKETILGEIVSPDFQPFALK